jgi:Transposase IS200 like
MEPERWQKIERLYHAALEEEKSPERIVSSAAGELGGGNGLSPDGSWILYWQIAPREGRAPPSWGRIMRQPVAGGPPETVLELHYSVAEGSDFFCPQKPGNPCVLGNPHRHFLSHRLFHPRPCAGSPPGPSLRPVPLHLGIIRNREGHRYRINGVQDHLHILTSLHPAVRLADFVKEIKTGSARWMRYSSGFRTGKRDMQRLPARDAIATG